MNTCRRVRRSGPRLRDSQIFGFEMWAKEYRGDLGIALSDVYGMNAFLRDFDMYFCKLFDGARHDSGDPFDWGERLIEHYEENRCDPRTKMLVFSDALDIPKVLQLYQRFRGRCQLAFGVGTNLTNDLGYQPLQIVIKMVRCNGQPVAKLSDSPGKNMCDDEAYLAYLRQVFGIEQPVGDADGMQPCIRPMPFGRGSCAYVPLAIIRTRRRSVRRDESQARQHEDGTMDTSVARRNILARIRSAQGRRGAPTDAERAAAEEYLERHPAGPRPPLPRRVTS